MATKKFDDLEIEEEAGHPKKRSSYKLAAQYFLLFLILLGLSGLTGGSFLGQRTLVSSDESVKVKYFWLGRIGVAEQIQFIIQPNKISNKKLTLWFDLNYLNKMFIKQTLPEPIKSEMTNGKVFFTFAINKSDEPYVISFLLEPQKRGWMKGTFGIQHLYNIVINQFIYP